MAPEQGSDKFGATVAPVGRGLGLQGLGCMYVQVEPGKRAFPFHNHLGNDEMFVILEGEGTYRFGADEYLGKTRDLSLGGMQLAVLGGTSRAGDAMRIDVVFERGVIEFRGRVVNALPKPWGSLMGKTRRTFHPSDPIRRPPSGCCHCGR